MEGRSWTTARSGRAKSTRCRHQERATARADRRAYTPITRVNNYLTQRAVFQIAVLDEESKFSR